MSSPKGHAVFLFGSVLYSSKMIVVRRRKHVFISSHRGVL